MILSACAEGKELDGKYYETYGFINIDEVKDPCVVYKGDTGSLVMGIIFSETVVAPVYIFGYDFFEPKGIKPQCLKGE